MHFNNLGLTTIKKLLVLTTLVMLLHAPSSTAQYFGRNNVQYDDFDFQVLETSNFNIYHYPAEAEAVEDLGRLSEYWYERHANVLKHTIASRNPLIIYANHADFQQNNIVPNVGVSTGGVTEGRLNRVVLPFAESNSSTNHVLGHELVHAFQYDIARNMENIGGIRATGNLPLWFIEGMAEYLSVGPDDTHTSMWLRDAVLRDDMPSIDELTNSTEYFPYRYGHAVWSYIAGQWGDELVPTLYRASLEGGLDKGIESTLGISTDSLSVLWNNATKEMYSGQSDSRTPPSDLGNLILGEETGTGTINAGPSLSPDGDRVVFISEKNLFSLELFLADAHTGEIIRKMSSTTTDPHLNALRFIESSGSWSPDGSRFAAVVFAKGDNQIIVLNTDNGQILRRLNFDNVDALTNPSWSPDGNKLVFSGSSGGYTDLFLFDFQEESLRQLTNDKYSDLQPDWSPDGERIAFMSDRGPNTNLQTLSFGHSTLHILNPESGEIRNLDVFDSGKHINPLYSPDGESLFFISDRSGINNVYRYQLQSDEIYQVTNVTTGISGISQFSPAITISSQTGDMIVTVFNDSNYQGYRISEENTAGSLLSRNLLTQSPGELPPPSAEGNNLLRAYSSTQAAEPDNNTNFSLSDYRPKLQLQALGAGGGIGISNRLGAGVSGGITMQFADILNQHQLTANINAQDSFKDTGGQLSYLNQDNRFLYGISASHFPYRTSRGFVSEEEVQIDGETFTVPVVERVIQRTFQDQISLIGYYPFSGINRLELSGGFTHIWYNSERQKTYLTQQGQPFDRTSENIESPSPLNLYNASLAYVEDNSLSAFTGPISGHRLRLDLQQTTGSLTYLTALADYRRYFHLRPFTLAFRALHMARYMDDAEDNRLSPNFVGYRTLVRGYNSTSFSSQECENAPGEGCAVFNRLIGSKMAVANIEFRIPVLGAEELALFSTNTIPMTLSPFLDAGYAWNSDNPFSFDDLKWTTDPTAERIPVFSAGASLRVNILGALITEFYYAIPFQRPDKNGFIGFSISPGW